MQPLHKIIMGLCLFAVFCMGWFAATVVNTPAKREYDLVLPVVNPWDGPPQGPWKEVGKLHVNTGGEKEQIAFTFEGMDDKFTGPMAWEAVARAMTGQKPVIRMAPKR